MLSRCPRVLFQHPSSSTPIRTFFSELSFNTHTHNILNQHPQTHTHTHTHIQTRTHSDTHAQQTRTLCGPTETQEYATRQGAWLPEPAPPKAYQTPLPLLPTSTRTPHRREPRCCFARLWLRHVEGVVVVFCPVEVFLRPNVRNNNSVWHNIEKLRLSLILKCRNYSIRRCLSFLFSPLRRGTHAHVCDTHTHTHERAHTRTRTCTHYTHNTPTHSLTHSLSLFSLSLFPHATYRRNILNFQRMWQDRLTKANVLAIQREDFGYVQRASWRQADRLHEEVIELDSPFSLSVAADTQVGFDVGDMFSLFAFILIVSPPFLLLLLLLLLFLLVSPLSSSFFLFPPLFPLLPLFNILSSFTRKMSSLTHKYTHTHTHIHTQTHTHTALHVCPHRRPKRRQINIFALVHMSLRLEFSGNVVAAAGALQQLCQYPVSNAGISVHSWVVCLFVCLLFVCCCCLLIAFVVCLFVCLLFLFVCLFVYLFVCLFVVCFVCFVCFVWLFVCLFVICLLFLFVWLLVCLFVWLLVNVCYFFASFFQSTN